MDIIKVESTRRNDTNYKVEWYRDQYHFILKKYIGIHLIETELFLTEDPAIIESAKWRTGKYV